MAKILHYDKQIKLIKEDVRQTTNKITKELAQKVTNDMQKAAYNIIVNYYKTYTPKLYKRTYNLYNIFHYKHKVVGGIANGHKATLAVTSFGMFDVYESSPDVVFGLVWNQGHRGLPFQNLKPRWAPEIMYEEYLDVNTSPHELMISFINNWGDSFGKKELNKIDNKYITDYYKSFGYR